MRIGSIIVFQLSKLWKVTFFILWGFYLWGCREIWNWSRLGVEGLKRWSFHRYPIHTSCSFLGCPILLQEWEFEKIPEKHFLCSPPIPDILVFVGTAEKLRWTFRQEYWLFLCHSRIIYGAALREFNHFKGSTLKGASKIVFFLWQAAEMPRSFLIKNSPTKETDEKIVTRPSGELRDVSHLSQGHAHLSVACTPRPDVLGFVNYCIVWLNKTTVFWSVVSSVWTPLCNLNMYIRLGSNIYISRSANG